MTKFMALYRADVPAQEQMANSTPEQAQAGMELWMKWATKAADALVDLGMPLHAVTHLGPGSIGASDVAGFSILQAESVEAVTNVLSDHPHLGWGGSIDVLEFLPIPGMG